MGTAPDSVNVSQVDEPWWRSEIMKGAIVGYRRGFADLAHRGFWDDLFNGDPFEIDRWADDGGAVTDDPFHRAPPS